MHVAEAKQDETLGEGDKETAYKHSRTESEVLKKAH
jgi:hypothetical protein